MSRILVVDDDPESRDLLSEVLEANGYPQVEAVADGLAAREALARDNDCPIIIADLHMPNESGLDLLRHLRKQNARHEIVLMSSFFSHTDETSPGLGRLRIARQTLSDFRTTADCLPACGKELDRHFHLGAPARPVTRSINGYNPESN